MVDNISPNNTNSSHKSRDHHHQGVLGYPTYGAAPPSSSSYAAAADDHLQPQDRLLPIANVGRIMKRVLPENAKISKEAKETMQECVSEFISFVTGEASEKCRREKRKTVNGDDICWALGSLGFDDFCEALKRYLIRYREVEGERANQNKGGGGGAEGGGGGGGGERDQDTVGGGEGMGTVRRGVGASTAPFGFTLMDKRRI